MSQVPPRKRRKLLREENGFQYTALDKSRPCIRLVKFLSRGADKNIRLELRNNVQLDYECPSFIAFSYEWGPPEPPSTVFINRKLFAVRQNLHEFLDTLYKHHKGRSLGLFWIDAVCIDQTDLQERNHQVQQMKQIYRQASKVFAWVGPSHGAYDGELVRALRQCSLKEGYITWDDCLEKMDGEQTNRIWSKIWDSSQLCDCFMDLVERSYWGRLWIVQELVLAQQVQIIWGGRSLDLDIILRWVVRSTHGPGYASLNGLEINILAWYIIERKVGQNRDLKNAISYFGDFACSLLHDKVYGPLGLAEDHSELGVNYDIPIERLFLDVLHTSDSHTSLRDLFILAEVLHLSFNVHEHGLQILCLADQKTTASQDLTLRYPQQAIGKVIESPPSGFLKTLPALRMQFKSYLPGPHLQTDVLDNISALQARCYCALCRISDPIPSEIPSEPDRFFERFEWFDSSVNMTIGQDYRQVPTFWWLFSKKQYFATVVFHQYYQSDIGNASVVFRDPFHHQWTLTDVTDEPKVTPIGPTPAKSVEMPMISALITIAHGLRKKAELDSQSMCTDIESPNAAGSPHTGCDGYGSEEYLS